MKEEIKLGFAVFPAVILIGTLWRVLSFHFVASPNTHLQHLGRAMSIQY